MTKQKPCPCCENPKEAVADILHTAMPDTFQKRLAELGLSDQYLKSLLQHFAGMFKAGISQINVDIEEKRQDQDEIRERLAGVTRSESEVNGYGDSL